MLNSIFKGAASEALLSIRDTSKAFKVYNAALKRKGLQEWPLGPVAVGFALPIVIGNVGIKDAVDIFFATSSMANSYYLVMPHARSIVKIKKKITEIRKNELPPNRGRLQLSNEWTGPTLI